MDTTKLFGKCSSQLTHKISICKKNQGLSKAVPVLFVDVSSGLLWTNKEENKAVLSDNNLFYWGNKKINKPNKQKKDMSNNIECPLERDNFLFGSN